LNAHVKYPIQKTKKPWDVYRQGLHDGSRHQGLALAWRMTDRSKPGVLKGVNASCRGLPSWFPFSVHHVTARAV
jgi:hypothetical protein